jgi:hypothetical protein
MSINFSQQTQIQFLINVNLSNEYENSYSFASLSAQDTFFSGKVGAYNPSATYQRQNGKLRINGLADNYKCFSYMRFRNETLNSKWYYAFVLDVEYVSEHTSNVIFEIDVIQTWLFDTQFKDCYIEREHVSNDTIGEHVQDEGLDVGEILCGEPTLFDDLLDLCTIIATKVDKNNVDVEGSKYSGVYSGIKYYCFDATYKINEFISSLNDDTNIVSIFTFPKTFINSFVEGGAIGEYDIIKRGDIIIHVYNSINGYTPKNNKLFTHPYYFIRMTNFNGVTKNYRMESFDIDPIGAAYYYNFEFACPITPAPTVLCYPEQYKGIYKNIDEGMSLSNFPLCTWSNDVYSNWLARNRVSNPLRIASGALGLASGIATGNPLAIGGGLIGVANSIGAFYEKSIEPNTFNGSIDATTTISLNQHTFGWFYCFPRLEKIKMIDSYFTRYGYKVNRLGIPNIRSRTYWNYLKMFECNLIGNIPTADKTKLCKIYKDGITFWHNDDLGNYNRTNSIR